ncbi:MAG: hypothetical protein AABX34_07620 [Nanoarchaeota archaeon]
MAKGYLLLPKQLSFKDYQAGITDPYGGGLVPEAFKSIRPRFQVLLTHRLGLYGETPKTQKYIGDHILHVTGSCVGQIEKKALTAYNQAVLAISHKPVEETEYDEERRNFPLPNQLGFKEYLLQKLAGVTLGELFESSGLPYEEQSARARNALLRAYFQYADEIAFPSLLLSVRSFGHVSLELTRQLILDKYGINIDGMDLWDNFSLADVVSYYLPEFYRSGFRRSTDIPGREEDVIKIFVQSATASAIGRRRDTLEESVEIDYQLLQRSLQEVGVTIKPFESIENQAKLIISSYCPSSFL